MRVLSEILDSTPMGYYLSFHIVYRIDKVSVYGILTLFSKNFRLPNTKFIYFLHFYKELGLTNIAKSLKKERFEV